MTKSIRGALPAALAIAAVAAPAAGAAPVSVNAARGGRDQHDLRRARDHGRAHDHDPVVRRAASPATAPTPARSRRPCPPPPPRSTTAPASTASPGTPTGLPRFSDFSVKEVAADAANTTQFWGLVVNFQFSQTGGCTTRVNNGDEVLWAFDAFSKTHVLRLAGPATATTGEPFSVRVTDGQDGSPAAGATVSGSAPPPTARATLSFAESGHLQAQGRALRLGSLERDHALRRPARCGSVQLGRQGRARPSPPTLPGRPARQRARQVPHGAGLLAGQRRRRRRRVAYYAVDVREVADGAKASAAAEDWRSIADDTVLTRVHFRGESGSAYGFRITAVDRATQPDVDRDRPAGAAGRRPRPRAVAAVARLEAHPRSRRPGAAPSCAPSSPARPARLRFSGRSVALIGRKLAPTAAACA